jgi:hypothetical protein
MAEEDYRSKDLSHARLIPLCRLCLRVVPPGRRCVCLLIDELERNIDQPSCGCRIEWRWCYDYRRLPLRAVLLSIHQCIGGPIGNCLGRRAINRQAAQVIATLNFRLSDLRTREES